MFSAVGSREVRQELLFMGLRHIGFVAAVAFQELNKEGGWLCVKPLARLLAIMQGMLDGYLVWLYLHLSQCKKREISTD